jgi:hypothetical protein
MVGVAVDPSPDVRFPEFWPVRTGSLAHKKTSSLSYFCSANPLETGGCVGQARVLAAVASQVFDEGGARRQRPVEGNRARDLARAAGKRVATSPLHALNGP